MKKKIYFIFAIVMTAAFSGCGNNGTDVAKTYETARISAVRSAAKVPECMSYRPYIDEKKQKIGFKDADGNIVIEAEYDGVSYSFGENGLVPVLIGDKFGYIDAEGNTVIEPRFEWAGGFSSVGLAAAKPYGGKKYGYINEKGEFMIKPKYETAAEFEKTGIAWAGKNPFIGSKNPNKINIIDSSGKVLNKNLHFLLKTGDNGLTPAYKSMSVGGYVDKTGKFVIEPKFASVGVFAKNGLANVRLSSDNENVTSDNWYGYINAQGEFAIENRFHDAGDFGDNGLAPVQEITENGLVFDETYYDKYYLDKDGNKHYKYYPYGYINEKGEYVIEAKFDKAYKFTENGLARVMLDGKYGFIDSTGEYVVPPKYYDAEDFSMGLAAVEVDGKYGFIDETGAMVIQPEYESTLLGGFSDDGLAYVEKDGIGYYIDIEGNELLFK